MAANIEIKARVRDREAFTQRVEQHSDGPGVEILQEDTFFQTPRGRLKLRVLAPNRGQLIYYERRNATGPARSDYHIANTGDPQALSILLDEALGIRGVVRKDRTLYRIGQTRVHLDEVEGLGAFMELEVVLRPNQEDAEGVAIASALMEDLGIKPSDLIDVAYIDLLASSEATT